MSKDWIGNSKSTYSTLGSSNHSLTERDELDFYATNPIAIDKLLTKESPTSPIWECACGNGALSQKLIDKGFEVFSSDIIERDYPLNKKIDFLTILPFEEYDCDILTNPPYKYALDFVLQALKLIKTGRKVYMFLKVLFLEGEGRYKNLFSKYPPKNVYIFSQRIRCAKNTEDFEGGGAVAYAWFVWEKGFKGKPMIDWI